MRALYHPELHREFVATLREADMTERECNWVFIQREGMIQNYCADLNAMHDAEESLSHNERVNFLAHLESSVIGSEFLALRHWPRVHATARQRAEAFLRTKGLWKE